MSVRQAQRVISSAEFAEWMAYDRMEPIGARRAEISAGIIAATTMNSRRSKRSDPVAKPEQFIPEWWRPEVEPADPEDMFEQLKAINQLMGGDFVGRES